MASANLTLRRYEYLWFSIVDNVYFRDIIEMIKSQYDTPEYKDTIILIGGNMLGNTIREYRDQYPNKKLIAYNWEQLCDGNQWLDINSYCKDLLLADEIWDYDTLNSDYLKLVTGRSADNIRKFDYFKGLEKNINVKKDIDILFTGLLNQKRANTLSDLHLKSYDKFKIVVALGVSPEETDYYIARSKIILNIHGFHPWARQEQSRIGLLLANKTCVVSEPSQINYFGNAIVETNDIFNTCFDLLMNNKWQEQADRGYSLYKIGGNQSVRSI